MCNWIFYKISSVCRNSISDAIKFFMYFVHCFIGLKAKETVEIKYWYQIQKTANVRIENLSGQTKTNKYLCCINIIQHKYLLVFAV